MSGDIASRYIGGVPYGPGRSVGRYPNAASLGTTPGVVNIPGVQPVAGGGSGTVTPISSAVASGGGAASGGGDNLLASLLLGGLGALQYLPDAYDALFGDPAAQTASPGAFDTGTFTGPGGVAVSNAAFGGLGTNWDNVFEPGTWAVDEAATQALLDAPMPAGDQFAGAAGDVAAANGGALAGQGYDFGLTGLLGELPGIGDVATGLADLGGGMAGYYGSQTAVNPRNPNSSYGHSAGSTIGGILGSLIPIPFIGTAVGSMMGGALGAELGDSMGAPPTVGRNFSSIGTLGGDGQIHWGTSGGDNGGTAADANGFTDWFGNNLLQQAAAQGYALNPNMAGAQIRVGGYDNFNRQAETPGGYFYDITNEGGQFGGSPEQYALRPGDTSGDAYSADQANVFTNNVLADLVARNVFTQGGQAIGGQGDLMGTLGTPYGWYYGGDFSGALADRQGAVTGYLNDQRQQAMQQAAVANTANGQTADGWTPFAYDMSQPIWYNGAIVNPGDVGATLANAQPAFPIQADGGA